MGLEIHYDRRIWKETRCGGDLFQLAVTTHFFVPAPYLVNESLLGEEKMPSGFESIEVLHPLNASNCHRLNKLNVSHTRHRALGKIYYTGVQAQKV